MFAVLDCGTTNTRVYIIGKNDAIVAFGDRKVGVRDTSITGSKDALRNGVTELFFEVLRNNAIDEKEVAFVVASGMITSEIGLMEIPHLVAPVGLHDLTAGVVRTEDPGILPIGRPVYFIRGIRNNYPPNAGIADLRVIDFMRGEEVQCMGVLANTVVKTPCSIVALSSHTKVMYIDAERRVVASNTTISGQLYEALLSSTNIGKSIIPTLGEEPGGYTFEQIIDVAIDCVDKAGLGRTFLMPRFMQVLLNTDSNERTAFVNAVIAVDDLKAFREMRDRGLASDRYIFYGKKPRCELYDYLLKRTFGNHLIIESIHDKNEIGMLTVRGAIAVADDLLER